jgi:hypothetical protein
MHKLTDLLAPTFELDTISDSKVLFRDYTDNKGRLNKYRMTKAVSIQFNFNWSLAVKITNYAAFNEDVCVDWHRIQWFILSEKRKLKGVPEVCSIEEETAHVEHERYMYECGLTSCGRDWSDF